MSKTYWTLTLSNHDDEVVDQWRIRKEGLTEEECEAADADYWISADDCNSSKYPKMMGLVGQQLLEHIIRMFEMQSKPVCPHCGEDVLDFTGEAGAPGTGRFWHCFNCQHAFHERRCGVFVDCADIDDPSDVDLEPWEVR